MEPCPWSWGWIFDNSRPWVPTWRLFKSKWTIRTAPRTRPPSAWRLLDPLRFLQGRTYRFERPFRCYGEFYSWWAENRHKRAFHFDHQGNILFLIKFYENNSVSEWNHSCSAQISQTNHATPVHGHFGLLYRPKLLCRLFHFVKNFSIKFWFLGYDAKTAREVWYDLVPNYTHGNVETTLLQRSSDRNVKDWIVPCVKIHAKRAFECKFSKKSNLNILLN